MASAKEEMGNFPLADHFANPYQQLEAGKLGMWIFLATEILLFGGLFVAYTTFAYLHHEIFTSKHIQPV